MTEEDAAWMGLRIGELERKLEMAEEQSDTHITLANEMADDWHEQWIEAQKDCDAAHALAERYRVACERMGQELHDALLHHKAGGTNTFLRCEVEPCKSWRTTLQSVQHEA